MSASDEHISRCRDRNMVKIVHRYQQPQTFSQDQWDENEVHLCREERTAQFSELLEV